MKKFAWALSLLALTLTAALAQVSPAPNQPVIGGQTSIAATGTSAAVQFPTTAVPYGSFTIYNAGAVDAYYQKGGSGCTATTSAPSIRVPAGGSVSDFVGTATYICGITATSSATLLVWQATAPVSFAIAGSSSGGGGGNSTIIAPLGSTTSPNAVSVVVASDQAAVAVKQATGTNLHAVLDTTSTTAVTQATAANLNATVVGTGTLAVQNTAATPAGTNVIGHVIVDTAPSTAVTQTTAANLNATVVGTGTFADQSTLQAGSAIVGKVGIDQTTPGTTNGVQVNAALPAGTNVIGHVIADSGSTTAVTQATAANLNATVVGTGTFAAQAALASKQSGVAGTVVTGCDTHAFYDASDNGKKTVVAGVSAKKIYICGYILATGGTATNLSLTSGTGTDCVTTSTAITPAYQLVANQQTGANSAFWNGLVTLNNADNLCVNASAGNAHQVEVWYTIQ